MVLMLVIVNPCFPFGTNDTRAHAHGTAHCRCLEEQKHFCFPRRHQHRGCEGCGEGPRPCRQERKNRRTLHPRQQKCHHEGIHATDLQGGRFYGKAVLTFPVPMLKISASVFKYWADNISQKIPLTTPPEVSYASQYLFFDNTKVRNELGLTFTPIEESLRDSVRWFRENKYAP